jgi:hypothetical protein
VGDTEGTGEVGWKDRERREERVTEGRREGMRTLSKIISCSSDARKRSG